MTKGEKPSNVFEYMSQEQTLGTGMLLSSISYSLVSHLQKNIFDPVFEELIPKDAFVLNIKFGEKKIDLGGAIYEIFRWVNYATIIYLLLKIITNKLPNIMTFFWMFLPFIFLVLMKRLFVYSTKSKPAGSTVSMTTTPSSTFTPQPLFITPVTLTPEPLEITNATPPSAKSSPTTTPSPTTPSPTVLSSSKSSPTTTPSPTTPSHTVTGSPGAFSQYKSSV